MKKLLSLMALGVAVFLLSSCSTDDEDTPTGTPAELYGTWTLVNDADRTITTTLTFSTERFINYSATSTTVNPSIPANCPTYTKDIVVDPSITDPYAINQKEYTKEQGYFTISGNQLTFWPQVSRTSTDGTAWQQTAAADLPSMELYTFVLSAHNIMIITKGDGTKQTYLK